MAGTFPESWQEFCLITIQEEGGTAYEYMGISETVDIGEPEYPYESRQNLAGGRISKDGPESDGEITIELYPRSILQADNEGLAQQFAGGTVDSSQPLAIDISWTAGINRQRTTFLVAVMWTDDTAVAAATAATSGSDKTAYRFYAKLCRFVSHKTSFTEGILKTTAMFKFPPMNKDGTTRPWAWESTNDTDTAPLPALTYSSKTDL